MLDALRQKHHRFIYEHYTAQVDNDAVQFTFHFLLEPDIRFAPTVTFKGVTSEMWAKLPINVQQNFAFHLGMAEVLSYWKAAASPEIVIRAGYLNQEQIAWWHDLLINGMGEYFFVNQIDFTVPDFVRFVVEAEDASDFDAFTATQSTSGVLVPVGGGKDSAVTLEILGEHLEHMGTLVLNGTPATRDTITRSKSATTIHIRRRIDPVLLQLNKADYLNGHTPFSSVLAFISVVAAALFDYRYVALSNERSSNEGNQFFHGHEINHQYSKTFDFEMKFRHYCKTYIARTIDYFSFLRPLYELQIARLFADMHHFHDVFRSCNVGQKTNTWCHNCSKCLFVHTMLYPFVSQEQLSTVFNHNLFERGDLLPIARELAGIADQKPFECVGTHEESRVAFELAAQQYRERGETLPVMLETLSHEVPAYGNALDGTTQRLLSAWNDEHAIPVQFVPYLRTRLEQVIGQEL